VEVYSRQARFYNASIRGEPVESCKLRYLNSFEFFDHTGNALLILGAPGGGKTTLLLQLAKKLLDRAKRDKDQPIPVVFHLSSWVIRRLPVGQWLVVAGG
jgi:predicted NACHT family NTPase